MSRGTLQRRLAELEQRPVLVPGPSPRRSRWDLACFTDEELEEMVPLAEKVDALGNAVEWTPAEIAVVARLEHVYQDRCRSSA